MTAPSYVRGADTPPLLNETIGQRFARAALLGRNAKPWSYVTRIFVGLTKNWLNGLKSWPPAFFRLVLSRRPHRNMVA